MSDATYYFDAYDAGEVWTTSPADLVDGNEATYASTATAGDTQLLNSNTCDGTDLGTITAVEVRVYGYKSAGVTGSIALNMIYAGGTGATQTFNVSTTPAWSSYFSITSDTNAPSPWTWAAVDALDCRVTGTPGAGRTMYASKVEVRVTYTPTGGSAVAVILALARQRRTQ